MSIRVALNHTSCYRYDRLVTLQPHVVRLRPAPHCRTPILNYSLSIEPGPHFLNWQQDPFSNFLARLVFPQAVRELRVVVDLTAELTPFNPFDFFIEPHAEHYPFTYEPALARELAPYLEAAPAGPLLLELVGKLGQRDVRSVDFVVKLNRHLHQAIRYLIRVEPGVQSPEETLKRRSGSCRDSAWLLVQLLRNFGLAARFVSGYLIQLTADERSLDGPSGPERDFTDLHAWAEVYFPGAGWVGLDATSGLLAGEGHLPLACAAEPTSAAPITGSFAWTPDPERPEERCEETFDVHMSVVRIHESPRVTKPYTDGQWHAILDLGEQIDRDLQALDVRLTMGGEPTFVSIDDRDAPEWNTTALGAGKQRQGATLLHRLREQFAAGGLLHFGQGKWYPGEPLPRWAYGCYWRRDGIAVWQDPTLMADIARDYGHTADEARRFAAALAERLRLDPAFCVPGYEDVWYHLWRERRLPYNVDPLQNRLDDLLERTRLARLFEQGLGQVVGYALPLRRRAEGHAGWESGKWQLRSPHLFLLPGDSPMGYRLPLDSLPWETPEARTEIYPRDPFSPRDPLPFRPEPSRQIQGMSAPDPSAAEQYFRFSRNGHGAAATVVRTALCVEPRGGRLHVFMPPVAMLEDYLELIAAVEATAAELCVPIVIEGYRPPADDRLWHFQITPDPGVLEVNIQPAQSWKDLVRNTTIVYEEARQARLSAEKFMLDGRHCGTGGGNHVVIGGPSPADSPILRRPDLLRSLLACWHNHPSLSYLFSSLFIGPTSQAPRVDEARNDSLYELDLAFQQVPEKGACPPWLVDRVFRHLLVDVTGNTHRAEFCIDKLYSPDGTDGRRGLLELRAFEMPPHARMSVVQQLLLRALIARFWRLPYRRALVRWGTELHDRFLLPHFIEQDFDDLLHELAQEGYRLDPEWFAAHREFRFPAIGSVTYRGVHLALRTALEPWHVLGEEATSGGTVRHVDSSVERLEVKVQGLTDSRHQVLCNGRRVPLHPTGVNGEYVAGVRYRAWQPPSCLHPTIGIHAPLVFDLLDTWTGRSLGGCQYHVAHPGGRAFERFPVNAGEAESRRTARFFPFGHTPGMMMAPAPERHAEAPLTLDLRHAPPAPANPEPASLGTCPSVMIGLRGDENNAPAAEEKLCP
jgi:uncharacterized protein (DUF2126 family)/transglutaminase-like putative cysteine protease